MGCMWYGSPSSPIGRERMFSAPPASAAEISSSKVEGVGVSVRSWFAYSARVSTA